MSPPIVARDYFQNAWVVEDIQAAMRHWTGICGVGPFFLMEHVSLDDLTYRGAPARLDFSIALAQAGRMQIELVQQHCDNPSVYRDRVPKGRCAFHHVAVFANDYEREIAAYEQRGCEVITAGRFGAMRFAYVDASRDLNCVIEVLEENSAVRDHFRMIAAAAEDWNGSDPVRSAF